MELPDRLEYYEAEVAKPDEDERYWYPHVFCTAKGCSWWYDAYWSDLGSDGDVDWDAVHPAHPAQPEKEEP